MKRYAIMFNGDPERGRTEPKLVTHVTYDAESAEEAIKMYEADAREWWPDYVLDDRIYAEVI